jgi:hypothetical protein
MEIMKWKSSESFPDRTLTIFVEGFMGYMNNSIFGII